MSDWIEANIVLERLDDSEDRMGLKFEQEIYEFKVPIRKSSIDFILPIPDTDGIPITSHCKIAINGIYLVIQYSPYKLRKELEE